MSADPIPDYPVWSSRRLWSLLDMLKPHAILLARLLWGISDFETEYRLRSGLLEKIGDKPAPVTEADWGHIGGYIDRLKEYASQLGLDSVPPHVMRINGRYAQGEYSIAQAARDLEELRSRIFDQLESRHFYFVPAAVLPYYTDRQLFGQPVEFVFPNAIDDIEDSGKCLALGQGTACVMHLMRVMEAGLKALAKELGIPYAPSWESYLTQIQNKIGLPRKRKTAKWKRDEPFFRDLSGDLMTVKQAWRNPTMHIVRKYSAEEAEEIFRAVKRFMQHLEPRIKSPASS
jgi:hypothetical protein